jgi:hypothetical protein
MLLAISLIDMVIVVQLNSGHNREGKKINHQSSVKNVQTKNFFSILAEYALPVERKL